MSGVVREIQDSAKRSELRDAVQRYVTAKLQNDQATARSNAAYSEQSSAMEALRSLVNKSRNIIGDSGELVLPTGERVAFSFYDNDGKQVANIHSVTTNQVRL